MLKRKANDLFSLHPEESDDSTINTNQEISQRKIFRAKRPMRVVPQDTSSRFRITGQLISPQEENKLLSIDKKPSQIQSFNNKRIKPSNPYELSKFSRYSSVEPFKEIIQNFNGSEEHAKLEGFLQSNTERSYKVAKFSADCYFFKGEKREKAFCTIEGFRDQACTCIIIKDNEATVLDKRMIEKDCFCKESFIEKSSVISLFFSRGKPSEHLIKIELDNISKHMFMRCFSECRLKSEGFTEFLSIENK